MYFSRLCGLLSGKDYISFCGLKKFFKSANAINIGVCGIRKNNLIDIFLIIIYNKTRAEAEG